MAVLGVAALGAALALSASLSRRGAGVDDQRHGGHGHGREQRRVGLWSQSATASTCVPHQTGLKIAGLDLANTPYMIMGGTNGMDMNGADASAAAGLQHDQAQLALHRPGHPAGRGAASCSPTATTGPSTSTWRRAGARRA